MVRIVALLTLCKYSLLEQNGSESRVESAETFLAGDLLHTTNETGGELGVRNETDTGGFKRA